jgi:hypothetical protein
MVLTVCDWHAVALALNWKGDETEAPAAGLVTVMLVTGAEGVEGVPDAELEMTFD